MKALARLVAAAHWFDGRTRGEHQAAPPGTKELGSKGKLLVQPAVPGEKPCSIHSAAEARRLLVSRAVDMTARAPHWRRLPARGWTLPAQEARIVLRTPLPTCVQLVHELPAGRLARIEYLDDIENRFRTWTPADAHAAATARAAAETLWKTHAEAQRLGRLAELEHTAPEEAGEEPSDAAAHEAGIARMTALFVAHGWFGSGRLERPSDELLAACSLELDPGRGALLRATRAGPRLQIKHCEDAVRAVAGAMRADAAVQRIGWTSVCKRPGAPVRGDRLRTRIFGAEVICRIAMNGTATDPAEAYPPRTANGAAGVTRRKAVEWATVVAPTKE